VVELVKNPPLRPQEPGTVPGHPSAALQAADASLPLQIPGRCPGLREIGPLGLRVWQITLSRPGELCHAAARITAAQRALSRGCEVGGVPANSVPLLRKRRCPGEFDDAPAIFALARL